VSLPEFKPTYNPVRRRRRGRGRGRGRGTTLDPEH